MALVGRGDGVTPVCASRTTRSILGTPHRKERDLGSSSMALPGRYYRQYPVAKPLGSAEENLELELNRTVFLIIDAYGRGYGGETESKEVPELYRKWIRQNRDLVAERIVPARAAARRLGLPIVYLTNYLSPALGVRSELRNVSLRVDGIDPLEAWREPNDILSMSDIIAPAVGEFLIKKAAILGVLRDSP